MEVKMPVYNIRQVFAKNIKRYRLNKNMSQEKLAELSELHRTYISDVEREMRSISLDNIAKIASALEVEVNKLFIDDGGEK